MESCQIYDCEASYSYSVRAPDRRLDQLPLDWDDVHPTWGIHFHWPDRPHPDGGIGMDGGAAIPHSRLESMSARFGFDPGDLEGIVDTLLHLPRWSMDDPLAMRDPLIRKVSRQLAKLPDPADPDLEYERRRETLIRHAEAVKEHITLITPAPLEDRQGALDYRRAVVEEFTRESAATGHDVPPQFLLGLDEQAPEHPLAALLDGGPLDSRRVAARRTRDEWLTMQARRDADVAALSLMAPHTFGQSRALPSAADWAALRKSS